MDDAQRRSRRSKDTKRVETTQATTWSGGRKTLASGSRPISNTQAVMARTGAFGPTKVETKTSDIESDHYCIDHKRSETGKYTIKQETCGRLRRAATRAGKDPALHFTFMPPVDDPFRHMESNQEHWVAIPKELFDEMDRVYRERVSLDGALGEGDT